MTLFKKHLSKNQIREMEKKGDVEGLVQALKEKRLCSEAADALTRIMEKEKPTTIIEGFIKLVKDEDEHIQLEAMATLGTLTRWFGAEAVIESGAMQVLKKLAKEGSGKVRREAERTVEMIEEQFKLKNFLDKELRMCREVEEQLNLRINEMKVADEGLVKALSTLKKMKSEIEDFKKSFGFIGIAKLHSQRGKALLTCPKCGKEMRLSKQPKFCLYCGARIS